MQVSNLFIAVVAEAILALLICTVVFFVYSRKLKALVNRQQARLLALTTAQTNAHTETLSETQTYKTHINSELEATTAQFTRYCPEQNIALTLPDKSPLTQRILALRYAFLRAEELGTTETRGTPEYWDIFQQALAPLLITYSDHIKHKLDIEQNTSQANTQITHPDSCAADEIAKLRHVTTDQHRIIHELQQKLHKATTTAQKELVIDELQQQLKHLIRFAQESETCIQLLEDELAKAHAEIAMQEKMLNQNSAH